MIENRTGTWLGTAALTTAVCTSLGGTGCREGRSSRGGAGPVADGSTALGELVGDVPILGQLVSDCLEDGTVVFTVAGGRHRLRAGDATHFQSTIPHAYANPDRHRDHRDHTPRR